MTKKKACVAFGFFEFVHKGHMKIAECVVNLAKEKRMRSVIVSLPGEGEVYTTEKEKMYLLERTGVEEFYTYRGEKTLEAMMVCIREELHAEWIVVGENHEQLKQIESLSKKLGIVLEIIPRVYVQEKLITYQWLEEAFERNDFETITSLCGHPYILMGDVIHGKKLGRTVGMPTINLHIYKTKKRPHSGVYATKVNLGEECYDAATNIGKRPTVDEEDYVTIETFILDFDRQIYGEICILEIHKFLREVRKFESLEEVQKQVQKDVSQIRQLFRKQE